MSACVSETAASATAGPPGFLRTRGRVRGRLFANEEGPRQRSGHDVANVVVGPLQVRIVGSNVDRSNNRPDGGRRHVATGAGRGHQLVERLAQAPTFGRNRPALQPQQVFVPQSHGNTALWHEYTIYYLTRI